MKTPELFGRHTSHYTRLVLIVAHELDVEYTFTPILDLMSRDAAQYGTHPGLRMPTLRVDDEYVFGATNICALMASSASAQSALIPLHRSGNTFLMNFDEILMQAMATQVTLVIANQVAKVDSRNALVDKSIAGLVGMLGWLDTNLVDYLARLPDRSVAVAEVALFCLLEHVKYRKTAATEIYENLHRFCEAFSMRPSAQSTHYYVDR